MVASRKLSEVTHLLIGERGVLRKGIEEVVRVPLHVLGFAKREGVDTTRHVSVILEKCVKNR